MGSGESSSLFDSELSIIGIGLAATFGKVGSVRYICTNFAKEIKKSDLFNCSILLSKA